MYGIRRYRDDVLFRVTLVSLSYPEQGTYFRLEGSVDVFPQEEETLVIIDSGT